MKDYPHKRSENGVDYACGSCGAKIGDGLLVLGHYTPGGSLTGVRVETTDGDVRHECGAKLAKGEGQHG